MHFAWWIAAVLLRWNKAQVGVTAASSLVHFATPSRRKSVRHLDKSLCRLHLRYREIDNRHCDILRYCFRDRIPLWKTDALISCCLHVRRSLTGGFLCVTAVFAVASVRDCVWIQHLHECRLEWSGQTSIQIQHTKEKLPTRFTRSLCTYQTEICKLQDQ